MIRIKKLYICEQRVSLDHGFTLANLNGIKLSFIQNFQEALDTPRGRRGENDVQSTRRCAGICFRSSKNTNFSE